MHYSADELSSPYVNTLRLPRPGLPNGPALHVVFAASLPRKPLGNELYEGLARPFGSGQAFAGLHELGAGLAEPVRHFLGAWTKSGTPKCSAP